MRSDFPRLRYQTQEPSAEVVRRGEPVSCGMPWPEGGLRSADQLRLVGTSGEALPLQARALDRWPDGSVRWCLLDWLADSDSEVRVEVTHGTPSANQAGPLRHREDADGGLIVETGRAIFRLAPGGHFPFASAEVDGATVLDIERSNLTARDDANCPHQARVDSVDIEESGPIRISVRVAGYLVAAGGSRLLELTARLHFYRDSAVVRIDLGLTNRRAAGHPGGIWSLGNDGSVFLRDLSLALALPPGEAESSVVLSIDPDSASRTIDPPLEIYQASSGGDNWRSSAHLDRQGELPLSFKGYRVESPSFQLEGTRATPIVELRRGATRIAASIHEFWQNFPKAIEAGALGLILRLFPRQLGSCHEIQGGERKTHTLLVAFAEDRISDAPLAWTHDPLLPSADPEWYAASGAIPCLTPSADDPNSGYRDLIALALEGDDTLEHKREAVDEFGWRHFGDVWADHEAARHEGDTPLISHYNNQYDMVGGLGVQFLRSGDGRWHRHMRQLARHVSDIDLYHTDRDKSAYNGGMFWHTVHYVDAGLSSHRSYPEAEGVPGGGPSTGHLYSEGLRLHHLLTGDPDSRTAVVQLGEYVIHADDGKRTIFRFLDRGPTGHVSNSGFDDYHGPGRSGANAIAALIAAHRVTGDKRFLDKAEELLVRCIHPADDLDALDLLDADRKWFYTMFLQSLGGYLDYKIELAQLDGLYAYGRAALLHYATWAAEHEYPYLEKPEILEFPTETWAAQDLRKSEMFQIAARHAAPELRDRFLERARFFFDASVGRLGREETRSYARPIALLLSNGWRQAWFDRHEADPAPAPAVSAPDFGEPEVFVSQKRRALSRAKRLIVGAWGLAVLGLGVTALVLWLARG